MRRKGFNEDAPGAREVLALAIVRADYTSWTGWHKFPPPQRITSRLPLAKKIVDVIMSPEARECRKYLYTVRAVKALEPDEALLSGSRPCTGT